jgi:tRNA A-37 threonylcarbamoyl transferase component Bud32
VLFPAAVGLAPFTDERRAHGVRAWTGEALAGGRTAEELSTLLERVVGAPAEHVLRQIPGRTTFVWPHDERVVVKRFHGSDLGDAWHDARSLGFARSPGRREAENLRELAKCGVPVPRALGWCEDARLRHGVGFGASFAWMERVDHRETLRQCAERDARAAERRWIAPLAELVARLHTYGWYHRDLYLEHWILADGRLVLLDVGRARRDANPRRRWFVKDIAALLHSCPSGVGARAKLRFLSLYLDARRIDERSQRREFARDVIAKARRIAAHEPRFVDPRPAMEQT